MKIACEIIRDLLPLFHDDVCSEASRILVEEHLSGCPACREKLADIGKDLKFPEIKEDEAKPVRIIANIWRKDKTKAFIKGTGIGLMICAFLFLSFMGLTQLEIIPVSSELLEVTDVCRLSDGRIVYHLEINDDLDLNYIKFWTNEDGSYYHTPYRSIFENKRMTVNGLYNDYHVFDIAVINAWRQTYGDGTEITSCYIGPENDGILIWEKGMELPPASAELERTFMRK